MAVSTKVPAGLLDQGLEFFFEEEELYATWQGRSWRFHELPHELLMRLSETMHEDKEAMHLLEQFGPKPLKDRLFLYFKCRCGGYDLKSDLLPDGSFSEESWNCKCNGNCVLAARFRNGAATKNGVLTKRELEVIRVLCSEPFPTLDLAAHKLCISRKTIDNHRQHIANKTGTRSIQELTVLATKSGWLWLR